LFLQVIKMLVAIVALFAICWSPSLIDNVLVEFGLLDRYHMGPIKHARQAFALMSYANSCVNPVVYAFMSKNFRNGFRKTLVCGRTCSPTGSRSRLDSQRFARFGDGRHGFGHGGGAGCGGGPTSSMMMMTTVSRHLPTGCRQMSLISGQPSCSNAAAAFAQRGPIGRFKTSDGDSDRQAVSSHSKNDESFEITATGCD
jgi:hypothetical protein